MQQRGYPLMILMADDDADDRLMAQAALQEARLANTLHDVEDGEELLEYVARRGKYAVLSQTPLPGLILLDLNMPRKNGREALREIKADPTLRRIPMVVLTTSQAEEDILRSYDLGGSACIVKPVAFASLVEVMQALGRYWFEIVELPPATTGV
jgi:CheY-like chemotaxis protein